LLDRHYELMLRFEREESAKNAAKIRREVQYSCERRFKRKLAKLED
jgi:hypothetical protein